MIWSMETPKPKIWDPFGTYGKGKKKKGKWLRSEVWGKYRRKAQNFGLLIFLTLPFSTKQGEVIFFYKKCYTQQHNTQPISSRPLL